MDKEIKTPLDIQDKTEEGPQIIEEIVVEELSIDGICGVY